MQLYCDLFLEEEEKIDKMILTQSIMRRIRSYIEIEKFRYSDQSKYPCMIWKTRGRGRFSYKGKQVYCKRFLFHYIRKKIGEEHLLIQQCPNSELCVQPFHMKKHVKEYFLTEEKLNTRKQGLFKNWNQNRRLRTLKTSYENKTDLNLLSSSYSYSINNNTTIPLDQTSDIASPPPGSDIET